MSAPTKAERDELRRLTAESGQWVTKGRWEIGGPYPSTSVIVCIDPGSTHPDCAEEPTYEPICVVDQRTQGEPNRPARAIAAEIVATHNALPGLLDYIDALEAALRPFAAIADKHAAAAKYLECPEKDDDAPVVVPIGYCRHAREVVKEKA